MQNYSIMPLFPTYPGWPDYVEEVVADVREQVRSGAASMPLFIMTLVPEDDPPLDKAGLLCAKYDAVKRRLDAEGLPSGILAQATIGHGYALNKPFPFRRMVNLNDGRENNVVCPLDPGFRRFMRGQFRRLAESRPAMIMVDDDFRLMARPGRGCCCPEHLALFNKLSGLSLTREALAARVFDPDPANDGIRRVFVETQREALVGAAREYRAGIDEVDPSLPGAFCACGDGAEFAGEIAKILAGCGNPVVLRVNNGRYTAPGARGLISAMRRAAKQIELVRGDVDVLLAETDTCPQNRYSTGAYPLHAHFTGSILEGCAGAKHWITRTRSYEPKSGAAYRKMLSKNAGFYAALAELVPSLTWRGARFPIPATPAYGLTPPPSEAWSDFFERLGLPMFFSSRPGGALFLDGDVDALLSDDALKDAFTRSVFVSAPAAVRLIARGFGDCLGVTLRPWEGDHPSFERVGDGQPFSVQMGRMELVPAADGVRADSTVYTVRRGVEVVPIFPGVTAFETPLGGKTFVFCGTPRANFSFTEAFSILCESRKAQLMRLLTEAGELPVCYAGDAEVYCRAADIRGTDDVFASFINVGLDQLDELTLRVTVPVSAIDRLTPAGTWESLPWEAAPEGEIRLAVTLPVLDSLCIRLRRT